MKHALQGDLVRVQENIGICRDVNSLQVALMGDGR